MKEVVQTGVFMASTREFSKGVPLSFPKAIMDEHKSALGIHCVNNIHN